MSGNDKQEKRQLLRYFLGDSHLRREEEADVGERVQEDPSWQLLSDEHGEHGAAAGKPTDWDTPGELRKLRARLGFVSEETEHLERDDRPAQSPPLIRHRRRAVPLFRVAVVLLLVACTVALVEVLWSPFGGARHEMQTAAPMRVVATEAGQRASIRLADGTQVLLSVDSELRIPRSMAEATGTRDVYLEGEAYFEVTEDSSHPFRVHVGGAVVRVLGTAFGVRAYPEDEGRQVVVAEGHVAVRPAHAAAEGGVHLTRGQMGRWVRRHAETVEVAQDVDVKRYLAWREGRLVFDGTPLGEVVARLERWYALDIQLADAALRDRSFTGSFEASTPAGEVLGTIAFAFGLQYRKEGRTVVLRPPRP